MVISPAVAAWAFVTLVLNGGHVGVVFSTPVKTWDECEDLRYRIERRYENDASVIVGKCTIQKVAQAENPFPGPVV